MSRTTQVPVTPSVLRWAIKESGYEPEQVAHHVRVDPEILDEWASGKSKPTLTQARGLASKLHRSLAALLLPSPPERKPLTVEFRRPIGDERELNPAERRHLRRAARFQELLSWIARELQMEASQTPLASIDDDPDSVAGRVRTLLAITTHDQKGWTSPSEAFDQWRLSLERTGHLVFLFSIGKNSCQGFSHWDEFAPVIAVNTARNESARIFTLFHELGHLITRTDSACVESIRTRSRLDPVERWCEQFAAAVLMPAADVQVALRKAGLHQGESIASLDIPSNLANRYKVSLRAAVIRLIELGAARWSLYEEIPPLSDAKPPGGGGKGRDRAQIREDQLGDRTASLLVSAVERDILSRSQAVEMLDVPDVTFDELVNASHSAQ